MLVVHAEDSHAFIFASDSNERGSTTVIGTLENGHIWAVHRCFCDFSSLLRRLSRIIIILVWRLLLIYYVNRLCDDSINVKCSVHRSLRTDKFNEPETEISMVNGLISRFVHALI